MSQHVKRNVSVKPKNRRRDRRRHLDLVARVDGHDVALTDISVTGFGAAVDATDSEMPDLPVGHNGHLEIWLNDGRHMKMEIVIKRAIADDGIFGGHFVNLPDRYFRLIEALLMGREHRV